MLPIFIEKWRDIVMAFSKPQKIAELSIEAGVSKTKLSLSHLLLLGFLGGAFISCMCVSPGICRMNGGVWERL